MDAYRISPNVSLPIDDMPLLHAAVNSEVERVAHETDYTPTDRTIRLLLKRGSNTATEYLGRTAAEAAHRGGLRVADAAFAEHARIG